MSVSWRFLNSGEWMKYRKKMNDLNEFYCLHLQRKAFCLDKAPSDGVYFPIKAIFNISASKSRQKAVKSTPKPSKSSPPSSKVCSRPGKKRIAPKSGEESVIPLQTRSSPFQTLKKFIKIAILTNYSAARPIPKSLKGSIFAELSMNLNEYGKNWC